MSQKTYTHTLFQIMQEMTPIINYSITHLNELITKQGKMKGRAYMNHLFNIRKLAKHSNFYEVKILKAP
jgi:hypothetical protein